MVRGLEGRMQKGQGRGGGGGWDFQFSKSG